MLLRNKCSIHLCCCHANVLRGLFSCHLILWGDSSRTTIEWRLVHSWVTSFFVREQMDETRYLVFPLLNCTLFFKEVSEMSPSEEREREREERYVTLPKNYSMFLVKWLERMEVIFYFWSMSAKINPILEGDGSSPYYLLPASFHWSYSSCSVAVKVLWELWHFTPEIEKTRPRSCIFVLYSLFLLGELKGGVIW